MSCFNLPPHQSGMDADQVTMPKKRQHGFDIGGDLGVHGHQTHPPHTNQQASSSFSNGSNGKTAGVASSFIDTDILLSDDLWNQLSAGTNETSGFPHHANITSDQAKHGYAHSHPGVTSASSHMNSFGDHQGPQPPQLMQESFIDIPQSQQPNFFGNQASSFHSFVSKSSQHDDYSLFGGCGRESASMEDSPEGSNGDSASTVATSIISPSSQGTAASSMSKSLQTRHRRSGSNASSNTKARSGRSVSRPNLKSVASSERSRAADRSPSQDRGGVGKAPTSRSRPSRRASIGPAAQAAVQASVNAHLRVDAQGAAISVGAAGKQDSRSPTTGLSSSMQGSHSRWSMFGPAENQDILSLQNLHLPDQQHFTWNQNPPQPQPGTDNATIGSLPTPLSFQASMQHLHLQTPPAQAHALHSQTSMDESTREASDERYNPFLFPPYAQPSDGDSYRSKSVMSASSQREGSEASQDHLFQERASLDATSSSSRRSPGQGAPMEPTEEIRPVSKSNKTVGAGATKERRASKSVAATQNKKALDPGREPANGQPQLQDECKDTGARDDDEDGIDEDDEDDDQPLATMLKTDVEAKRLAEKRRRRRESHNAVERRRRDNINEKITELATLLPEAMLLDAIATSTQGGNSGAFAPALAAKAALAAAAAEAARGGTPTDGRPPGGSEDGLAKCSTAAYAAALAPVHANSAALAAAQAKPNKGIILRKSVEYIRHLQQFLDMQMDRIGFLEAELQRHRDAMQCSGMPMPSAQPEPVAGLFGFSSTFTAEGSGGFFGSPTVPQEMAAGGLMDLGMPAQDNDHGQLASGHAAPSVHHGGQEEANRSTLVDWLDGFDQRTGLPRRSSVDPIEEEEEQDGLDRDPELRHRGRSGRVQVRGYEGEEEKEEVRGRSRQREKRGAHTQHGSWPTLEMSGAQSPIQLLADVKDEVGQREFSHLGEFEMQA